MYWKTTPRSLLANCGKAAPSVWWYSGWRWHSAVDGARTDEIGQATAQEMQKHSLVLWPFHGVFGSGSTLDETFGLIDTAEKISTSISEGLFDGRHETDHQP